MFYEEKVGLINNGLVSKKKASMLEKSSSLARLWWG